MYYFIKNYDMIKVIKGGKYNEIRRVFTNV